MITVTCLDILKVLLLIRVNIFVHECLKLLDNLSSTRGGLGGGKEHSFQYIYYLEKLMIGGCQRLGGRGRGYRVLIGSLSLLPPQLSQVLYHWTKVLGVRCTSIPL
jgi:hypothetical protein